MIEDSDNEKNCFGVGVFKPLPEDHPFQRAALLHDSDYRLAELVKLVYETESATEEEKLELCSLLGIKEINLLEKYEAPARALVDSNFFWRLVLLARAELDPQRQCDLMMTICRYWPLAREFGRYLYDGEE